MMKRLAFLSYDFSSSNMRKQPWNYVYRICHGFEKKRYDSILISAGNGSKIKKEMIGKIPVYYVGKVHPFINGDIENIIDEEDIDVLFWSFSPKSIFVFPFLRKLKKPVVLFMSLPLYTLQEVLNAQKALGRYNLNIYYKNCLIPKISIRTVINSSAINGIIVPSKNNATRLMSFGCARNKVWYLPHGIDGESCKYKGKSTKTVENTTVHFSSEKITVLYLGGAEEIRGLHCLIKSFGMAIKRFTDIRLLILLRTENKALYEEIGAECLKYGVSKDARIVFGVLSEEMVQYYLSISNIVALPFILVPSEVPISILEAMKAGKPVIGTAVDGIPELIEERGVIVKPGDAKALSEAIVRLSMDDEQRIRYGANGREYMAGYPSWDDVIDRLSVMLNRI